jgi:8-oxo-dGTP pyrophosphatase MutT (NUDIX family)
MARGGLLGERMQEATLCLLIQGEPPEKVLLGYKKVGFGAGKYTCFGGKIEAGETAVAAAVRELAEESGLEAGAQDLEAMGTLTFRFPWRPAWSQKVYVFVASRWRGHLGESREMIPAWFAVEAIPYADMWQDSAHWLPRILAGQRIRAYFTFGPDNERLDHVGIEPWDSSG